MARYRVEFLPRARRAFLALPRSVQERIQPHIDALAENPRPPGARMLTGNRALRIRIGDYRVIYTVEDEVALVLVVEAGHRREVNR